MTQQESETHERPTRVFGSRYALALAVIFLAAVAAILILGWLFARAQRADILARKGLELSAVRDLKIEQILEWRAQHEDDGKTLGTNPALRDEVDDWLANPDDPRATSALRSWLDFLQGARGYSDVAIISADGSRWLSTTDTSTPDALTRKEIAPALAASKVVITDLYLGPATGRPRFDVIAPVIADHGGVPAVIVLHGDPSATLSPLLAKWPTPSPTSETLLVRPDGDSILFLNELRFRENTALRFRLERADNPSLLAVQTLTGPARTIEGIDYRGVPVLGAVSRVGDTDWYLVAKVDRSEALEGLARSEITVVTAALALLIIIGLGLMLAWRQRSSEYLRQQLETEQSKALLAEQYGYLTRHANDVVILADEALHILQVNERASSLYGYTADELLGMSLDDLLEPGDDKLVKSIGEALFSGGQHLIGIRQRRADGTSIEAEMSARAIDVDDRIVYLTITRDVTERNAAERALRASEEQFRNIFNCSPTGIYLYRLEADNRLVLTSANPAADHIIGIEHRDMIGKTIEDAFPNLVDTEIPTMYRSVARGDIGSQTFEIPYEDNRFAGYYSVTVFRTLLGMVAVDFTDISDRKRAEDELQDRTEELQRSNAELERFAYIASHDLQEPLRMVASYTQLLQQRYQGQLDQDADEFIGFAVDGATRMQTLINDLLAYSRVGSQGAEFIDSDLNELLSRVLQVLDISIRESGGVVTHERLPTVRCDPTQIGQVFQNLIGNALKFHGDDPPRVHIGAKLTAEGWVFCIKDNGLGIEPEYFDRIFVIFQRLQSRAQYPGTGMGLAICKRIVERHGGHMWVESELGKGSTFCFSLKDHKE